MQAKDILAIGLLGAAVVATVLRKHGLSIVLTLGAIVCALIAPATRRETWPELAVIGDIRALVVAENAYASWNGGAYGRLLCLSAPASCGFTPGTPPFIDPAVAANSKQGYRRWFIAGAPKRGSIDIGGVATFAFLVVPSEPGITGNRGFCADDTGRVCFTLSGAPPQVSNGRCAEPCMILK